jgi:GGDEF domain-containing protein
MNSHAHESNASHLHVDPILPTAPRRLLPRFLAGLAGSAAVAGVAVAFGQLTVPLALVLVGVVSIVVLILLVAMAEAGISVHDDLDGERVPEIVDGSIPMIVAVGSDIVRHNRAFAELLLAGDASFAGRPMAELVDQERTDAMRASTPDGTTAVYIVWRREDGTSVVTECRGVRMDSASGRATWTCVDVTESIERQPGGRALSLRDDATGLLSREGLLDRFDDCFVGSQVLAVDLDRVEDLRETLGSGRTEDLMAHVGNRIAAVVGDLGPVCRYGANELVVVLPSPSDEHTAAMVAGQIKAAVREVLLLCSGELVSELPVGRAVLSIEDSLTTVVDRARDRRIAA